MLFVLLFFDVSSSSSWPSLCCTHLSFTRSVPSGVATDTWMDRHKGRADACMLGAGTITMARSSLVCVARCLCCGPCEGCLSGSSGLCLWPRKHHVWAIFCTGFLILAVFCCLLTPACVAGRAWADASMQGVRGSLTLLVMDVWCARYTRVSAQGGWLRAWVVFRLFAGAFTAQADLKLVSRSVQAFGNKAARAAGLAAAGVILLRVHDDSGMLRHM